ncbi:MAG: hypothetical protein VXW47_01190 [Pseudomonadota bacterium]|nr:hypothetical protein [Pseudomonadota bacterium]
MISIHQYLKDNIKFLEDSITLTYLMNRCSAAYVYAAEVTKDKMPDSSEKFGQAANKTYNFSNDLLVRDMNYKYNDAVKKNKAEIKKMFNYYTKDGKDLYARTGQYIKDSYISLDLQQCNTLMLAFEKK